LKCDGTRAETRLLLSAKRTSPFKSAGASVQSTTGSRCVRISGSNAGYIMFRGSVKGTGYPFHSPVSPSFPLPCVTVCHHISTGLYLRIADAIDEMPYKRCYNRVWSVNRRYLQTFGRVYRSYLQTFGRVYRSYLQTFGRVYRSYLQTFGRVYRSYLQTFGRVYRSYLQTFERVRESCFERVEAHGGV
jgi:hypothetical protein